MDSLIYLKFYVLRAMLEGQVLQAQLDLKEKVFKVQR